MDNFSYIFTLFLHIFQKILIFQRFSTCGQCFLAYTHYSHFMFSTSLLSWLFLIIHTPFSTYTPPLFSRYFFNAYLKSLLIYNEASILVHITTSFFSKLSLIFPPGFFNFSLLKNRFYYIIKIIIHFFAYD